MAAAFHHPHDSRGDASADGIAPLDPASGGLTRRSVVHAGIAVGAAAWLGGAVRPAAAVAAQGPGRLVVRRSALTPGRTIGPIAAPHRFDLLGAPVATVRGVGLRIRGRAHGGRWSAWRELSAHDGHAPDGRRARMSDPIWFGGVDELQLRVHRRPAHDVRLDLVAIPPAEQRSAAQAVARAAVLGGVATARARREPADGGAVAAPRSVPTIIPRSAWGPGLKPRTAPQMGKVLLAFVHHTVNANTYTQAQSAAIVRAITEYHVRSNGWNDIGYNFLVDRFGQIFEGRAGGIDRAVVGAQAIGWNSVSTGIAIIGTFQDDPAPEAALNAVASLIGWKLPLHGTPTAGTIALVSSGGAGNRYRRGAPVTLNRVSGHRDGCSTDCPGDDLYGQLDTIRARVGASPVVLSITVPEEPVAYGRTVTVQGRLTDHGVPVAAAAVTVHKRGPSGTWVPMTRATTDADGHWEAAIVLRAASAVRATGGGVSSPSVTPGLDPRLGLRQPTRRMHAGRTVLAHGTAHGVKTVTATLRRREGGRYIVVTRKELRVRHGRYHGRLPVRRPGKHRLTVEATSGRRTYHSRNRYLRAV